MISVVNIIKQVRIDVKDINEVKYSDWDIENALNKALRLTSNHFSMLNTDFMERSIAMLDTPLKLHFSPPIAEGIADELHGDSLPEDFISVVKVIRPDGYELHPSTGHVNPRNYMIYRGCIFAFGPIILMYRCGIPNVSKDDTIDLPIPFFDFLVEGTKLALTDTTEMLTQYITDNALKLIPARRYSGARVRLPWRV